MIQNLEGTLAALLERILVLANQDAELRTHLRGLAQMVLAATDVREPAEESPTEAAVASDGLAEQVQATLQHLEAAISHEPQAEEPVPTTFPELTLGRSLPPSSGPPPVSYPVPRATTADLMLIEARCRLKAEAARWAATRRRRMVDGVSFSTEIDPGDRHIIARAKAIPNCFLWMCHPSGPSPSNLNLYEQVAGCFETLADALALVKQIQDEPEIGRGEFEGALDLLAEAQSALRISVDEIEAGVDSDQNEVFYFLRAAANEHQILIGRFMRLDDPADPSQWSDLAGRIEAIDARLQEVRRRSRQHKKLLGKIRHKASLIAAAPESADEHWRILVDSVDELVNDGLPPSNRELREILVPVIEHLSDLPDVPRGFQVVLREIDRFMSTCPPPETPAITQPTQQVVDAARLLKGRSVVLIGGDRRPGAFKAIKEAFGLSELLWIETQEHESIERFESYVARPEVAVVLLAIRWSSHSHGEVSAFCDRYGKPLVRLPGGYNPNQVAAQIMAQCSERLR